MSMLHSSVATHAFPVFREGVAMSELYCCNSSLVNLLFVESIHQSLTAVGLVCT